MALATLVGPRHGPADGDRVAIRVGVTVRTDRPDLDADVSAFRLRSRRPAPAPARPLIESPGAGAMGAGGGSCAPGGRRGEGERRHRQAELALDPLQLLTERGRRRRALVR